MNLFDYLDKLYKNNNEINTAYDFEEFAIDWLNQNICCEGYVNQEMFKEDSLGVFGVNYIVDMNNKCIKINILK